MKFIELTTKDGKKVMVNLDNVTHILDGTNPSNKGYPSWVDKYELGHTRCAA